jgi:RNA polymerase sigma-70 factor (family 1)
MASSVDNSGVNRFTSQPQIEDLFNQYYSRLCFFALKLVYVPEVAKDIVQDIFLKCLKNNQVFDSPSAAKNFLYLSVRNACLNHIRHSGVEKRFASSQEHNATQESEMGLDQIIWSEVIGEIRKALEELPEGCKMVIHLGFIEGLKNEEIAQEMGISVNTVKSQKQRALKLLRLKLDSKSFLILLSLLHHS